MQTANNKIRIGLLATGNELTEGDILNTNGQSIAQQLTDAGLMVGMHIIAADSEEDIIDSLNFLLEQHDVIIITGGLGPTSDDLTRFALSKVIKQPLIFDQISWDNIVKRYQKIGLNVQPHPNNQQQALFPAGATILTNLNGTAAGCYIKHANKFIYMLPGPPNECLPMFKEFILPSLLSQQYNTVKKLKWRLLGVIESEIAAKVEAAVKGYSVKTGYRIDHPYLDVKIYTAQATTINEIETKINELFSNYILSSIDKTTNELLQETISQFPHLIYIEDQATYGQLQAQLITPLTFQKVFFNKENPPQTDILTILIAGLQEFWQGQPPTGQITLTLQFKYRDWQEKIELTIPFRSQLVVKYALEYIAREILNFLKKIT